MSNSMKEYYRSKRYSNTKKALHVENAIRNSKIIKNTYWWNNGKINRRSKISLGKKFVKGRLKYTIKNVHDTEYWAKSKPNTKSVIIKEKEYFSIMEASRKTGKSRYLIRKMLIDGRAKYTEI